MKRFRFMVTLMVLAAWLPATSHCLLGSVEMIPGACHQEPHSHGDGEPEHSHDDCGQCVLETGSFKLAKNDTAHLGFTATLAWLLKLPTPPTEASIVRRAVSGRSPPDIARYHFLTRAALPGRAPALL